MAGYDENGEWDGTTDSSDIAHIPMGGDTYWCWLTEKLGATVLDDGTCSACGRQDALNFKIEA